MFYGTTLRVTVFAPETRNTALQPGSPPGSPLPRGPGTRGSTPRPPWAQDLWARLQGNAATNPSSFLYTFI